MTRKIACRAAGVTIALAAYMPAASAAPASVDVLYVAKSDLELTLDGLGSDDDDGDGFAARLAIPFGDSGVDLRAEFSSVETDDFDLAVDQLRAGFGFMAPGDMFRGGVVLEYVSAEIDIPDLAEADADGFGVHGRGEFQVNEHVDLFGQIGYLRLKDEETADGPEFAIGALLWVNPQLGIALDYRYSKLEDDAVEYELSDIRAGVRLTFGG